MRILPGLIFLLAGWVAAQTPTPPVGVIFVLIDDIGYGDIDVLSPSSLETPVLDRLYGESVRLSDFHVGTSCSPTRASLMTGRSVNAGGAWHTIAGRELLREDEQTLAEVFRANGWRTGIFGKWHLGEGYPFSPRFRGFDQAVIHGGGGVGQGPDHWGNDYDAGDVYCENGMPVVSDRYCTDYWFARAKQFIEKARSEDVPFFCYIPTNAAHSPFNEPAGYKDGFDGLIENIDDNMGWLDDFLEVKGIKDDVLLIFSSDNGTTGRRLGGLRGRKGSHYDGGHKVPCFWRWKNGGVGGGTGVARDVSALTASMDVMPTLIDLMGLKKPPGGNPLHGTSLKDLLLDPAAVSDNRVVVVDTQRQASLSKWHRACVMRDDVVDGVITRKWRLIRGSSSANFELYDILTDPAQGNDVAQSHGPVVSALAAAYETWWEDVSRNAGPYAPFVLNEDHESELSLFSHSWIGENSAPWSQDSVKKAENGSGTHAVRFDRSGRYRFELRRWPRENGGSINGPSASGGGTAVPAEKVRITVAGTGEMTQPLSPGEAAAVFEMDVSAGPQTTVQTALLDASNQVLKGAYYLYVSKIGDIDCKDEETPSDEVERTP